MKKAIIIPFLIFLVSACSPALTVVNTDGSTATESIETVGAIPSETATPTASSTATDSPSSTVTPVPATITPTFTSTPSQTPTSGPSLTPTVSIPEGTVLQQSACRYGPGAAYLFEWGLYPGDYVRIIHRNWDATWLDVKPDSFHKECWVRADLLDVRGNIYSVPYEIPPLPFVYTRLYEPARYVIAIRDGDLVTVEWEPIWMTEDDDRGYLIEAWVCLDGKLTFQATDYHPWTTTYAIIRDEPGCNQLSSARFYTVEKHGYMKPWVDINWPAFPIPTGYSTNLRKIR